jgi:hypothetical protein
MDTKEHEAAVPDARRLEVSDAEMKEVESLVNATLRELVFLEQHANQFDVEDCESILCTIDLNVDRLRELLAPSTIQTCSQWGSPPQQTALDADVTF